MSVLATTALILISCLVKHIDSGSRSSDSPDWDIDRTILHGRRGLLGRLRWT